MSDKAAKLLLYGMLAIAVAILLARDIYIVEQTHNGVGVFVINQWTGTMRLCAGKKCVAIKEEVEMDPASGKPPWEQ